MLVRNFSWSGTALRIGLPADEAAWRRLEQGLAVWKNSRNGQEAAGGIAS